AAQSSCEVNSPEDEWANAACLRARGFPASLLCRRHGSIHSGPQVHRVQFLPAARLQVKEQLCAVCGAADDEIRVWVHCSHGGCVWKITSTQTLWMPWRAAAAPLFPAPYSIGKPAISNYNFATTK